jgi:hypothetical protein
VIGDLPRYLLRVEGLGSVPACCHCGKARFPCEAAAYRRMCEDCQVRAWLKLGLQGALPLVSRPVQALGDGSV